MQNEIAGFSYYFYRIIVELKFEDSERYSCIIFAVFFFFLPRKFLCNNFAGILLIFVRHFVIQSKLCIRLIYIFYSIQLSSTFEMKICMRFRYVMTMPCTLLYIVSRMTISPVVTFA